MSFCRVAGLVHDEQVADALAGGAVEAVLRGRELHGRFDDLNGREEDVVLAVGDSLGVVGREVQLQLGRLLPVRVPVNAVEGVGQGRVPVTVVAGAGGVVCGLGGRGDADCGRGQDDCCGGREDASGVSRAHSGASQRLDLNKRSQRYFPVINPRYGQVNGRWPAAVRRTGFVSPRICSPRRWLGPFQPLRRGRRGPPGCRRRLRPAARRRCRSSRERPDR